VLPFSGEVTAVLQEPSGRIIIAGDNGGGGCCTLNWAAAISARGRLESGFGTRGREEIPTGGDSGVEGLALEPPATSWQRSATEIMAAGASHSRCYEPSGRPVPQFGKRLGRFRHGLGFGAFVGDVYIDGEGFTLVGTGQRPCADGPSFSAPSATGLITRFRTNGEPASRTIRFPSRMYRDVNAFHDGADIFVVVSPYADSTQLTVTARRLDGSARSSVRQPRPCADSHALEGPRTQCSKRWSQSTERARGRSLSSRHSTGASNCRSSASASKEGLREPVVTSTENGVFICENSTSRLRCASRMSARARAGRC
jgi:hypothetical protein